MKSSLTSIPYIESIDTISIIPLLKEVGKLEHLIKWTDSGTKGKQTSIQHIADEDPWSSGVGKSKGIPENEYNILNPAFQGTLIENIINKYCLFRTRLMWVNPMSCYSMHKDSSLRIHIPIVTNPDAYFIFKNSTPLHIPEGNVYKVNTREYHTFVNCSEKSRLHLVGCVFS